MLPSGVDLRNCGNASSRYLSVSDKEEYTRKSPGWNPGSCWDSSMGLSGLILHNAALDVLGRVSLEKQNRLLYEMSPEKRPAGISSVLS